MDLLNIGIKKILCVCQKSKVQDWIHQFKDNYDIQVYDLKKDLTLFLNNQNKCVGVINYDLLIRRETITYLSNFVLLLDESSLIQNNQSKRCKFVLGLRPAAVVLLSGTPGKYEKLWSQCKLLGWNIYKKDYDSRYCNYELVDYHTGHLIPVLNKQNPYKNVEELKEKLRSYGAVFKKTEEVIDLPEQVFTDIEVERTKEYDQFLKERVITIDDEELVGDHAFKNYLFKRRLCSVYNKGKLDALKDLIESTDDRLIIFYNWDIELRVLKEICKDRPISEINGHTKDLTNYEKYKDSITLCQFAAGSMGLNLQLANKIIYFTPTDKSEQYEQSLKRVHRIGQSKTCFYYRLIVSKSIEEKIYDSLARQEDYKDYLFEEDY